MTAVFRITLGFVDILVKGAETTSATSSTTASSALP
jgi:hypothetical protein